MSFVGAPLLEHARRRGGSPALACGERRLTFAELGRQVEALAAEILAASVRHGRVLLCHSDPFDLVVAALATARAGRVAVVADPSWSEAVRAEIAAATRPDLTLAGPASAGAENGAAAAGRSDAEEPLPDDPFYVGFTSGSTGRPKGFRRSHRSWTESFALSEAVFGLTPDDRVLILGGLGHSLHLYGALQALHIGAAVTVTREFRARAILARIAAEAVTVLYATPTQVELLARAAEADGTVLSALRVLMVSGAKWRDAALERVRRLFPQARLFEFYGTSETSFVTVREAGTGPEGSVGRAMPGIELEIRDEDGRSVPAGETGRVWVRSALLFDGYETGDDGETLWRDGFVTVGDRGFVDAGGHLFLAGRAKRMLVTSGVNVFAEEIEAVLERHPAVAAAAVFGLPDALRGMRIVAGVRLAAPCDIGDLVRHCRDALPPIRRPRAIHPIEDWPLTAGGKTDLRRLEAVVAALEQGR